ncbi:hypothetical protein K504DRAFT_508930 [Pleomassaria siparia CBS 279.74]|uniref:Uncharacterized protein n=1 Tax=Pleomassaria siparia CBS 279.74 TaxID=1314801 RepID=A0A6G1JQP2_9PLEO|nr:hypothetical protein K504DRAFT_508930 [Pleomassaria siparia CBS 279.74]
MAPRLRSATRPQPAVGSGLYQIRVAAVRRISRGWPLAYQKRPSQGLPPTYHSAYS